MLGKGGMGTVYAALDGATGQRVAIKSVEPDASPRVLELFKREYRTLHGLRHPNIVEVYEYGSDESGPFYTMELLEGCDLSELAPLPWRTVCSHLRQVASLLGMLHARRLLHRDISPRNVWVLPDGRTKLIDFGALAPFGTPSDVVGTPPFIAPEWLRGKPARVEVDQRADLFALGALGYWLLTTKHAYPARSLADLARAWEQEPPAPSSLVCEPASIPPELDALILSLLRLDPATRPARTELVIGRIDAIAGPVPEPLDHAVRGHVRSNAFVGRSQERQWIERQLERRQKGGALLVHSTAGLGRSRLLDELALVARLGGAIAVSVRGSDRERAHGMANALALGVLATMPSEAAREAKPHASLLAQLSPELKRVLDAAGTQPSAANPVRSRELLQQALSRWVFALAEQRCLVVLVDDLQDCDPESVAWLASLARSCAGCGLLLVAAQRREPGRAQRVEEQLYEQVADVLELQPLTAAESRELLSSVFGPDTAYLDRVSQSLHAVSRGNPAHCLELLDHLVQTGVARYSEGSWTLPGQLAESELPHSRSEVQRTRLAQLSADAQRLGALLSIQDGHLSRDECEALSELTTPQTAAALVELVLHGLLTESEQGYAFTHDSLRRALQESLDAAGRARAHARLGAALLKDARDPIDAMRAGLHLFEAGDHASCERLVRAGIAHLFGGQRERMHVAVPLLERALSLYEAAGWGDERLVSPLAALAMASFFADHRLAHRYGARALDVLERVLSFPLARKLQPRLGGKLALYAALGRSALARTGNARHRPRVADLLRMLIGTAVALNGVATASTDVALTERCARAFDPLAPLGELHVAGFVRRCTLAVSSLLREDHAASLQELQAIASLMDRGVRIPGFPEHLKYEFLGGCLFSIGLLQSWRQDAQTLAIAQRIETISPMHAMNADNLRASYYTGMGDMVRAQRHRQRAETRALQLGAAWQVVTLGPIAAQLAAIWTHDARLAKHASAEIERLSAQIPSLRREAVRSRAIYLVLSGRYAEAIEVLRRDDASRNQTGFTRAQGVAARAHNRLGHYAQAREVCQAALAGRSEQELSFVIMYLHAQLELSFAQAGLGEVETARERIAELLRRHASTGRLALGAIHETAVRMELVTRDLARCREHLRALRELYLPTQLSSLADLTASLEEAVARAEHRAARAEHGEASTDGEHAVTRMQLVLSDANTSDEVRTQHALRLVLELTGAQNGMLLALDAAQRTVFVTTQTPQPELLAWAKMQLTAAEPDTVFVEDVEASQSGSALMLCGVHYRAFPHFASADSDAPSALLVLGFLEQQGPVRIPARVWPLLASHITAHSV